MREKLKDKFLERGRYKGEFSKYGLKSAYKGLATTTICLINVSAINGEDALTDHIWLNLTKGFKKLGYLTPGDVIAFDARVRDYEKGYGDEEKSVDYKLSHPTKIEVLSKSPARYEYKICSQCHYPNRQSQESCRRCGKGFSQVVEQREEEKLKQIKLFGVVQTRNLTQK